MKNKNLKTDKEVKEIEVKYKLAETKKEKVLSLLKEYNAEFLGSKKEIDIYYTRADVDFMKTRECLRVRETDEYTEITYKPPTTSLMKKSKRFWKKETNLRFKNQRRVAEELLECLGCKKLVEVKKERLYYKISDLLITIDKVENLGWFLEIEIQGGSPEEALKRINSWSAKFLLTEKDVVERPYRDLVMEKLSS